MSKSAPQLTTTRDEIDRALTHATQMARIEIVTALREPQRKLVCLLHNRAQSLADDERFMTFMNSMDDNDIDALDWGLF